MFTRDRIAVGLRTASVVLALGLLSATAPGLRPPTLDANTLAPQERGVTRLFGVPDPTAGPGNAHRMILWTSYEALINLSDDDLDAWKSRGVDGFVVQTRYLRDMGGLESWTGDPKDPLAVTIIEGADVHERQRTLRDNHFVQRCHARGLAVYLGIYLSNYPNLSTPLKVWDDDAGWAHILPIINGAAGAATLLGMDGMATDSENYHADSQTWNWDYPGVTKSEAEVRALARQRGHEMMATMLAAFPNIEIINYRIEIPGDWEEKVQAQVNHVAGVWNKSVFVDFWNGMTDSGGFRAIHFFDPIFYKSWQVGSGWDEALAYDINGVNTTLSQRWTNWSYASSHFFLSPFAWIDPGPSAGSFDDARPVDYVTAQLNAFHRWGEGNMFGLYAQHILDFDYTPYVDAMRAASTPDSAPTAGAFVPAHARSGPAGIDGAPSVARAVPRSTSTAPTLRVERVAEGLQEPTDSAFTPDGRLLITERTGRVRIVRDGQLKLDAAVTLSDAWIAGRDGLLAIAIDPDFARTHFVYVVYTAISRAGAATFRLARFREVNDSLGDRAVLLDGVPASGDHAAAALRIGPDGKLYAAFDAGGDLRRAGNPGSYNGKIVRLNRDGSTPADQPAATPIYAHGFSVPSGLAWQPASNRLWIAGRDAQQNVELRAASPRDFQAGLAPGSSFSLPSGVSASAMTFYRGDLLTALTGNLLAAGGDAGTITRIEFDSTDPARVIAEGNLLSEAGGRVRTLSVSPDGVIYFCVDGRLERLIPAR